MWAVLFTDLVGSTAQRARLGDEAGDLVRREHDAFVWRALAAHRGEFVDGTGDGAMCVFASAADAIAGGVAIQQAVERRNRSADEPIGLRVGVSAGELVVEGSGLMGLAAHEAARVCGLCEPGQVLVTDLVRLMAGSRTDAHLLERGGFDLKGIPEPVTVWEVAWEAADVEPLAVPSRLLAADAWAFSGRDDELTVLRDLWEQSSAGGRRAVLISGEPGVGKTRLAAEAARLAREQGALVLYGQSDDELGSPYQPLADALDWYLEQAPEVVTGRYPGDLTRLSARVRDRVPHAPDPLVADPETEQRRLFDAVVSWLSDLAAEQPVVLVLDDLHWATRPSLLMLRHLLRHTDDARLLVIGTYRDTDLDRRHPLGAMLADFRRMAGVQRVLLSGLDEAGVLELLVHVSEQEADDRTRLLARALVVETEGNPFFVTEVLRHLAETGALTEGGWTSDRSGDELGIPEGVREVVGQRLDRLSESANDLLTTAAMVGREFTVALLTEVSGRDPDDVLTALDEASGARIVEEIGLDRFRFSHALVRMTLREEVGASRRLRLHRRIAEALERIDAGNHAALAHHWLEAATAGDPGRAIDHAIEAATSAGSVGAYDDAMHLYGRALELADDSHFDEARRELLLALAEAQILAGTPEAKTTLVKAIETARGAGDTSRMIRGAARLGGAFPFSLDARMLALIMDAIGRSSEVMPRERARLLVAGASQVLHLPWEERAALAEDALAIARRADDPELLVDVGSVYIQVMTVPEHLEQRLELAHEMEALEPRLENALSRLNALPVQPAWEAGLLDEVDRSDARSEAIREQVPFSHGRAVTLQHRAKRALFRGDLETADRCAEEAYGLGPELPEWYIVYVAQLELIRCEQGRAHELTDMIEAIAAMVAGTGLESVTRSFRARFRFESGDVGAAAELLSAEAAGNFEAGRRDGYWYPYHAHWAEIAAEIGDRSVADVLRAALVPYADRIANFVPVAFGTVSRLLGRLETVLGRYDDAQSHLAHAAARHEEFGAKLHLARTWADQAEVLMHRDDGRAERAPALLDRATAVAEEHGALGVQRYVERVGERARAAR
jgi:class 3 adenylate cyclase/tetratricopeptide (TPR) repeat protein